MTKSKPIAERGTALLQDPEDASASKEAASEQPEKLSYFKLEALRAEAWDRVRLGMLSTSTDIERWLSNNGVSHPRDLEQLAEAIRQAQMTMD
jgi:hypothetical protein